ncbi:galactose oxidase [Trametes sanguinea]|nr:galactose oxidase [Trametes sanguinea]
METKKDIDVVNSRDLVAAFTGYLIQLDLEDRRNREVECQLLTTQAESLLNHNKYGVASRKYAEALTQLVGPRLKVPLEPTNGGGVVCPVYRKFTMKECLAAMTCCNGVARCLNETKEYLEALDWTIEVDVIHKNARFVAKPIFDWEPYHPSPPCLEFHHQRLLGLCTASDVFLALGNTGSAAYCRNVGNDLVNSLPSLTDKITLRREVLPRSAHIAVTQLRHPDPTTYRTLDVRYPELQVRGSWRRLKWADSSRLTSRMAHAAFIYKSRLYVCGGQRSGTVQVYHDMWCLDLVKMNGWRELPKYKEPFLNCQMVVVDKKAYLFRGFSTVDFFDLESERWGSMQTRFVDASGKTEKWPYSKGLTDYVMHAIDGKIYIFGGRYKRYIGSNLFAVLDVATRTWRHLSGTPDSAPMRPTYDEPGVRKNLASWVDEKGEKLYIMYGMADRQAAQMFNQECASSEGFAYDDCWSWDIKEERWQRERVSGNYPCPRAEMSVCYNPVTKQTVMFGGYNPALPYFVESSQVCFGFNYFSDTFVLDQAAPTPRWKQVITPSFPTYRAQGQLLTDPATGRMYLFGGYTNTDWVPTRHTKPDLTRSYGDVWELRVDTPGGLFEEVDWEDERRCAQLGPWQACYKCGSVGFWKKCSGSCDGRVHYCTPNCQKEAWPEHKQKHNCTKV